MAYAMMIEGPAAAIPAPEPTKSPAPITPPRAIIERWRCLRPWVSAESAEGPAGAAESAVGGDAEVRGMDKLCSLAETGGRTHSLGIRTAHTE
ncbi:hypothetical protein GCM10010284_23830 [Streptomyces rubiginosohelvolus]|uniref:Uncharacterized protein n=1 Tax=Streptomyces rubiginosohelvolus TaxID=67362 RepID=A0ABQ3C8T5_9ACTN|nr:hypothetical protein GCM10010284_23830 [Streptomyces rubiginosohelvolus]GGZ73535.1 hypothetical protein GCM10010328_55620 [Streptomyces pluricolorescens]